jgi:hypothetical protein
MTGCRCLSIAAAGLALLLSGCSDRPKLIPVSGVVLIDGQPLPYGAVQVQPKDARAAYGELGPDGRFTLTCYDPNDGCVPGTHTVVVVAGEPAGPNAIRWLAPKKYSEGATSGLTIDVKEPTDKLVIELTWDGGKPFIERYAGE